MTTQLARSFSRWTAGSLFLLLHFPPLASGFAAWLACFVDLQDETEVIMHQRLVPYSDASEAAVRLEVHRIDINATANNDTRTNATYYEVKAVPSPEYPYRRDWQFVVEILPTAPKDAKHKDSTTTATAVAATAKFTTFAMCDGRRAYGATNRRHDEIRLEVDGSGSCNEPVKIVAAYAAGYEAVQMTDVVVVGPPPNDVCGSSTTTKLEENDASRTDFLVPEL